MFGLVDVTPCFIRLCFQREPRLSRITIIIIIFRVHPYLLREILQTYINVCDRDVLLRVCSYVTALVCSPSRLSPICVVRNVSKFLVLYYRTPSAEVAVFIAFGIMVRISEFSWPSSDCVTSPSYGCRLCAYMYRTLEIAGCTIVGWSRRPRVRGSQRCVPVTWFTNNNNSKTPNKRSMTFDTGTRNEINKWDGFELKSKFLNRFCVWRTTNCIW